MKELFTDLRDLCMLLVLVGLIVLGFCFLFPPPVHAGQRCVSVAAAAQTTTLIAVPVAVPAGYPVYASPVGNVGMVAYGSATKQQQSDAPRDREAKSVGGPVPPTPDGRPYLEYLAEYREYLAVIAGVTPKANPTAAGAAEAQAAPAALPSLIEKHCVSCHNPTGKAKHLDLTAGVPDEAVRKVIRRLLSTDPKVAMPPPEHPIDDRTRGELLAEIADE